MTEHVIMVPHGEIVVTPALFTTGLQVVESYDGFGGDANCEVYLDLDKIRELRKALKKAEKSMRKEQML